MKTPKDRYQNDNEFRTLVDMMNAMIHQCQFTPSELREAAILASIMYAEQRMNFPRFILTPELGDAWNKLMEWTKKESNNG